MRRAILTVQALLLFASCSVPNTNTIAPTPTPEPGNAEPPTAAATAERTPTATERPTETPEPTETPTPVPTPTSTPVPSDVPPVVRIVAPPEARVGDENTLDGSGTFDWDGDTMEFSWVQFHNPDKYAGTEYVTGNDAVLMSPDGQQKVTYPSALTGHDTAKFKPQWPGNYRFTLTAQDKDGASEESVDVLVKPLTPPWDIRAFAVGWHAADSQLTLARYRELLEAALRSGANYIEIPAVACMPNPQSNEILSYPGVPPNPYGCVGSFSDEFLRDMIRLAKEEGLGVLLAPQTNGFGEGHTFFWTGSIQPESWDVWFSNFEAFIDHYALIAQEENVDILQVGNEYNSSQHMTQRWKGIIDSVREIYGGRLTYGVTNIWFAGQNPVGFWKELDFIGLHAYFPATGIQYPVEPSIQQPFSTDPDVQLMVTNLDEQMAFSLDRIQRRFDKPVIVTELCAGNYDGSNSTHFKIGSTIDNAEQYEFFEAAFRVLSSRDYVEGVFIWALEWRETRPTNMGISPLNKPAMDFLDLYFD